MTITLQREARRHVELFTGSSFTTELKPKMTYAKSTNEQGNQIDVLHLTDVPVFRSGVFRDSFGVLHTWETIHMDQMVAHFDLLTNRKIVESFPVRKGHGGLLADPMDSLIGMHTALRTKELRNPVDGQDYLYLLADYTILDAAAIQNISSGLWKNRSAEVGAYVTNAEAEFWPVYMGVAYVDFSAVEGLNVFSKSPGLGTEFSLMFENNEEAPVAGTDTTQGTPAQAPAPAAAVPTPPAAPAAPATPAVPAAPAAQSLHNGPVATATFSINGQQTSDYAAVQLHISTLEATIKESREQGRKNFIKSLAEGNAPKISAAQIPQLEAFALDLPDEKWTLYAASWDAAPVQSVLGLHAGSVQTNHSSSTPIAALDDQIAIAEGVIKQFKLQGQTDKQIATTSAYERLTNLRAERAKTQS